MNSNDDINIDIKARADTGNATQQAARDIDKLAEGVSRSGKEMADATARAKTGLQDLAREVANGNFSKVPGALLDAAASSGMLTNAVIAGGIAFAGAAAMVGVAVKAYADGAEEIEKMNVALVRTANSSGQTSGAMRLAAREMADSSNLTISAAKDIAIALADSGRIGAQAFSTVSGLAGEFGQVMRVEADKIAPALIKLFDSPTKGARELNDTLHFLSATEMDHIRALEDMGNRSEAQAVLAELLDGRLKEINQTLNTHTGIIDHAKKTWSDFWDMASGVGRDDQSKIDERLKYLEWKAKAVRGLFSGISDDEQTELTRLRNEKKTRDDKAAADAAAAEQKDQDGKSLKIAQSKSKSFKASSIDASLSQLQRWSPETDEQRTWQQEALAALQSDRANIFKAAMPAAPPVPEWQRFADRARTDLRGDEQGLSGESMRNLDLLDQAWKKGAVSAAEYEKIAQRIKDKDPLTQKSERLRVAGDEAIASVARLGNEWTRQEAAADRAMQIMPAAARKLADELAKVDKEAAAEQDKISKSRAKGTITDQAATEALAQLTEKTKAHKDAVIAASEAQDRLNGSWEYGAGKALQTYQDKVQNVATQTEEMVTRAFTGMEDALVGFVKAGKLDFRSLADSIISDLIRIQVRQSMTSAMSAAGGGSGIFGFLSGLFGGGGGSTIGPAQGSVLEAGLQASGAMTFPIALAKGDVFSSADLHNYANTIVSSPTLFKFAQGGAFRQGLMGEAGPEAIMPLSRGSDGSLGVRMVEESRKSGGLSALRVEIINQGSQQVQVKSATPEFDGETLVVRIVQADIAQDGPISQQMQKTYGLGRGAGAY